MIKLINHPLEKYSLIIATPHSPVELSELMEWVNKLTPHWNMSGGILTFRYEIDYNWTCLKYI